MHDIAPRNRAIMSMVLKWRNTALFNEHLDQHSGVQGLGET